MERDIELVYWSSESMWWNASISCAKLINITTTFIYDLNIHIEMAFAITVIITWEHGRIIPILNGSVRFGSLVHSIRIVYVNAAAIAFSIQEC